MNLRAPYPYFGGKSKIADLVWKHFGDVPNYCEPFYGSGAVLLARPHEARTETVNDLDCMVANFWRAIAADPDAVADHCDWPINEADLHARHEWLVRRTEFRAKMHQDPEYFDAKIAGWWVWGICSFIGGGWCSGKVNQSIPRIHAGGVGINRVTMTEQKRPSLGKGGRGIHRTTLLANEEDEALPVMQWFRMLSDRLRRVRVCCGNWDRILGPCPTTEIGTTAVFLDPPYSSEANRDMGIYAEESGSVAHQVREWAIANGDDQRFRIALCGYDGEHKMPESWVCIAWKATGGYGNQSDTNDNAHRERIWFSPHCLNPSENVGKQMSLFEEIGA